MLSWRCSDCQHYHVEKGCEKCAACRHYESRIACGEDVCFLPHTKEKR